MYTLQARVDIFRAFSLALRTALADQERIDSCEISANYGQIVNRNLTTSTQRATISA